MSQSGPISGPTLTTVKTRLTLGELAALYKIKAQTRMSVSTQIAQAVAEYLQKKGKTNA